MSQKYQRILPQIVSIFGIVLLTVLTTGCEQAIEYLPPLPELPTGKPQKPPVLAQTPATTKIEAAVRQGINKERVKYRLKPLQNNNKLALVARRYSRQMAAQNFCSHTGADGSTLDKRVHAGGISYWVVGEKPRTSPEYSASCFSGDWCRSLANWQHLLHHAVVSAALVILLLSRPKNRQDCISLIPSVFHECPSVVNYSFFLESPTRRPDLSQ